jgi:sensor domain CHASE-containing protein
VTLNSKAWDWANWDELYRFAADGNAEFIETNLADSTFVELKLNLILIVISSGPFRSQTSNHSHSVAK